MPHVKALFVATTCLTVLLGVGWLFFPTAMLSGWGIAADAPTVYMARRYGLLGALSGVCNPSIWLAVAIEAALSVAFVYQLAAARAR